MFLSIRALFVNKTQLMRPIDFLTNLLNQDFLTKCKAKITTQTNQPFLSQSASMGKALMIIMISMTARQQSHLLALE